MVDWGNCEGYSVARRNYMSAYAHDPITDALAYVDPGHWLLLELAACGKFPK